MPLFAQIPALPDLTHPNELLQFGQQLLDQGRWLIGLLVVLGVVLAVVNVSYRGFRASANEPISPADRPLWLETHLIGYGQLLRVLMHSILAIAILISGFFLCSTLANRYHHWEQAKITQVAGSVAGERVEQAAPVVRYTVAEAYKDITFINGKPTEVERSRRIDRFLSPSASQAAVKLTQANDPATSRLIYQSEFSATYDVTNTLDVTENFTFEAPPPSGYTLLQDYRVEQSGQRVEPQNQGDYRFPLKLKPGSSTQFRVTYKAQGAPRWVYTANGKLLSKFRLTVLADFPNADFASGILPTETQPEGKGTRFTWAFAENVSVQNPFGVFTATQRFSHTGVLPRLLLLAPGILLGWLLLLYLLVPMRWQDLITASAIFFACLLALTYASRLLDAKLAWGLLAPILLVFGWSLGRRRAGKWRSLGATFSGAVLPVLGFLVPYTGLTLGIAGLSAIGWLMLDHWQRPT
jgi:hypothetical protein